MSKTFRWKTRKGAYSLRIPHPRAALWGFIVFVGGIVLNLATDLHGLVSWLVVGGQMVGFGWHLWGMGWFESPPEHEREYSE